MVTAELPRTKARAVISIIFDRTFSDIENVAASYANNILEQLPFLRELRLVTSKLYQGPKLGHNRVKVKATSEFAFAAARAGIRKRLMLRLGLKLRIAEHPDHWSSDINTFDEVILRQLMDCHRFHAVVIFSQSPEFILKVARYSHIFSGVRRPHIIGVTAQDRCKKKTLDDLCWLGVTLLADGELAALSSDVVDAMGIKAPMKAWTENVRDKASEKVSHRFGSFGRLAAVLMRSHPPFNASKIPARKAQDATMRGKSVTPQKIAFATETSLSFFDNKTYPYRVDISPSRANWQQYLGAELSYPRRVADIVLFVRPDWGNCGSGTYFASLAQYFRRNDTLMIDVATYPFSIPFTSEERHSKIAETNEFMAPAANFSLRHSKSWVSKAAQIPKIIKFLPRTVSNQMLLLYSFAARPSLLKDVISAASITQIYLNHYFSYGFFHDFLRTQKFHLDTHDIQAINAVHSGYYNALTGRLDDYDALIKEEMKIVGRAERVSFVSLKELEIAKAHLPAKKIFPFIALPQIQPLEEKAAPNGNVYTLLFVASRNPPNERNIDWFMELVWPKLQAGFKAAMADKNRRPPRLVLEVCGGISSYANRNSVPAGINFLGIVDRLEPRYEKADLVILPVVSGGGAAMKTIEAMLYGRPIVGTKHAFRGLPPEIEAVIGSYSSPDGFAEAILRPLISDRDYNEVSRKTRAGAKTLLGQDYFNHLTQALNSVRLSEKYPS